MNRKYNIELSPKEYWIDCYYEEALLYCFQLIIDGKTRWRLPYFKEYYHSSEFPSNSWWDNRSDLSGNRVCIPVRDII